MYFRQYESEIFGYIMKESRAYLLENLETKKEEVAENIDCDIDVDL